MKVRDQSKLRKVGGPASSLTRIRMCEGIPLVNKLVSGPTRGRGALHCVEEHRNVISGVVPLRSSGGSLVNEGDVKGTCSKVGLSRGGKGGGLHMAGVCGNPKCTDKAEANHDNNQSQHGIATAKQRAANPENRGKPIPAEGPVVTKKSRENMNPAGYRF